MQIGICLGDPAGIGPELVDALLAEPVLPAVDLVIFGHRALLPRARTSSRLTIVEPPFSLAVIPGQPSAESARAQVAYLEDAAQALFEQRLVGIVTAPINKYEAERAGFRYPGHTEFFASLGGRVDDRPVTMSFVGPRLRVALATAHLGLRAAIDRLVAEPERITQAAVHLCELLRVGFGVASPRIAVAGLNPHAGERGRFGTEEAQFISAIAAAQQRCSWAQIVGPVVPDVVFRQALLDTTDRRYDAVVALYHDQGLIPCKTLDFDRTVNVTLGLPFVRTSPDHGTAYDIAGRGVARPDSMRAALALCVQLVGSGTAGSSV